MDSQASVSSSASTVPLDLIHDQDNDFVDETHKDKERERIMQQSFFNGHQLPVFKYNTAISKINSCALLANCRRRNKAQATNTTGTYS